MEVVREVVIDTVSERENEEVMETVRERVGDTEIATVAAAAVAPWDRDVLTLTPAADPAEVETLVDNPPPAEAEREMLTVTPPLVALMLPETVPEQSLRRRALV